jgi:AMP-polyphosphate phosphotransferase
MFESAELGHRVPKKDYEREVPQVREALLRLQAELAEADFPVIIVIGGVDGAGKSETINTLLSWLDARDVETHTFDDPSERDKERPRYWRYWQALPPKKKIGILFNSWYTDPAVDRVFKRIGPAKLDQELERIKDFEQMLAREGALILKFWLHISKEWQRKRLQTLEKDPDTAWRVTDHEWRFFKKYDEFRAAAEHSIRMTDTGEAPWHVVEGSDERYRHLTIAQIIRDSLERRLERWRAQPPEPPQPDAPLPPPVNLLSQLDLSKTLNEREYDRQLLKYQARLNRLTREMREKGRSMTMVLEGPDAAGKGGAIRRVIAAIDARMYRVISVSAPTQEEKAQHYLWRFWRHVPRQGRTTIYDRSWYGRVLVERLEGYASIRAWQRAFQEINDFEAQLVEGGIVVVKLYLQVSAEEQLRRFKTREQVPYKHYKITEEDWRNREKYLHYEAAACDMIQRTSTEYAPWTLVEADDKRWARVKTLRTTCEALERFLDSA